MILSSVLSLTAPLTAGQAEAFSVLLVLVQTKDLGAGRMGTDALIPATPAGTGTARPGLIHQGTLPPALSCFLLHPTL